MHGKGWGWNKRFKIFLHMFVYVWFTWALVLKPLWSIFIYLVCKQPGVWSVNTQHKKLTVFVSLNNPLLQAVLTKGYCEWMGFCFGHQPPNSLLQFSHWKGITRNWLHIIKEQRLALPLSLSESCCFCKSQQRLIHGQFLVIIVSLWWPFCVC